MAILRRKHGHIAIPYTITDFVTPSGYGDLDWEAF